MANTYSQIYIHIIFAVKNRKPLIRNEYREEIQKYITGIITNKNQKLISIHCMPDHVHIFVGIKPKISISDLVRDIKNNSSKFINGKNWLLGKFNWQEGFGAFSCGYSQIDIVDRYIKNQEYNHKKISYRNEYIKFLEKYGVEYEEKYI